MRIESDDSRFMEVPKSHGSRKEDCACPGFPRSMGAMHQIDHGDTERGKMAKLGKWLYACGGSGFTLRDSIIRHAACAWGRPLSAAAATSIWKLAGNPVAESGYPAICPACHDLPVSVAMAAVISG